jgi:hypothetical protein
MRGEGEQQNKTNIGNQAHTRTTRKQSQKGRGREGTKTFFERGGGNMNVKRTGRGSVFHLQTSKNKKKRIRRKQRKNEDRGITEHRPKTKQTIRERNWGFGEGFTPETHPIGAITERGPKAARNRTSQAFDCTFEKSNKMPKNKQTEERGVANVSFQFRQRIKRGEARAQTKHFTFFLSSSPFFFVVCLDQKNTLKKKKNHTHSSHSRKKKEETNKKHMNGAPQSEFHGEKRKIAKWR